MLAEEALCGEINEDADESGINGGESEKEGEDGHAAVSLSISMSSKVIWLLDFIAILIFQAAGILRRASHFRMAHSPAPQALATFEISFHLGGALLILMRQILDNLDNLSMANVSLIGLFVQC